MISKGSRSHSDGGCHKNSITRLRFGIFLFGLLMTAVAAAGDEPKPLDAKATPRMGRTMVMETLSKSAYPAATRAT